MHEITMYTGSIYRNHIQKETSLFGVCQEVDKLDSCILYTRNILENVMEPY